jgi:hypothetical protein
VGVSYSEKASRSDELEEPDIDDSSGSYDGHPEGKYAASGIT